MGPIAVFGMTNYLFMGRPLQLRVQPAQEPAGQKGGDKPDSQKVDRRRRKLFVASVVEIVEQLLRKIAKSRGLNEDCGFNLVDAQNRQSEAQTDQYPGMT